MTSAADFTRQQPKAIAIGNRLELKMPEPRHMQTYGLIGLSVFMVLATIVWVHDIDDCRTRGLLAGAQDKYADIEVGFGRCVARVDGKWIEVKR